MRTLTRRSTAWRLSTLLGLGIASSALGADDTAVRLPPLYNTFQPPALGQTYTDSVFGVAIRRVSDAIHTPNHAAPGNLFWVGTEYSTASPFNSNNSWLILEHQGYFGLYDGYGTYVRDLSFAVDVSTEPRWSRTDPNILFYVSSNRLMKLDVAAGTSSIVHVFSEYAAIRGRGESDISRDGDHFVFAGDAPGGLANRYVFVYEISTNTKGPVLDTIGHSFDQLYLAPDNSVVLGWILPGTARFTGIELFDRNMVFQRQLTRAIGHMHLTRELDGTDVLVWTNSDDPQPIPNCQNGIVKVTLSTAAQTCLLQLDWSLAVHIAAGDGDGWVFVETYAPGDPPASLPAWKPYTNEILQLRLDGTETRRLLHHRSRQTNNYEYQPRVAVSRDGYRLVYSSTYNQQGVAGHAFGYTDAYFVAVPALVPPRLSISDASVVEGDSGTRNLVFTVSLTYASNLPISVDYAAQDDRAVSPEDFTAIPPTTLTFAPGETSHTVTVSVNGDLIPETNETVLVTLTNGTNVVIADDTGRGTIINDDIGTGDGLKGYYFNSINLSGPSVMRVDPTVDFDWGAGPPGPFGVGADHISVRWMGRVESLLNETFSFCTRTDDGARLWVDNVILVDHWADQTITEWCGSIALKAGFKYDLRMEYYDNAGSAGAHLYWSSPSTPKAIVPQARLYSRYPVDRRRTLDGSPVVTGDADPTDAEVETSQVPSSVAPAPPKDAAVEPVVDTKVTTTVPAEETAPTHGQARDAENRTQETGIEERTAVAIRPFMVATSRAEADRTEGDGLVGDYFSTMDLSGPSRTRMDPEVNFEWGTEAPGLAGPNGDHVSIRWTGWVEPLFTETYTFCTNTDDGVRLWIDGQKVVDQWSDQALTEWCGSIPLEADKKYELKMEYFENTAGAVAKLYWSSASTPKAIVPRERLYSTKR